jgi:hypothetical protein
MEKKEVSPSEGGRRMFRKKRTVSDLMEMAKGDFNEFQDLDLSNGCIESCEVF